MTPAAVKQMTAGHELVFIRDSLLFCCYSPERWWGLALLPRCLPSYFQNSMSKTT